MRAIDSKKRIEISGSPFETGRICGSLFQKVLSRRLAGITGKRKKAFEFESARLKETIEAFAPAWMEELEGIRDSAGICPDDIILLNCLGYLRGSCTSVLSVNGRGEDNILHKNRDEAPLPQFFFVKRAGGSFGYSAGGSVGDIGVATFLNEKGLAGANNSGSITRSDELSGQGKFSDCHLMRLVAERASSCEEALEIIKSAVENRVCGSSGGGRGMIFLFSDRDKGLIVENTSRSLVYEYVWDGLLHRTNDYRLPGTEDWIDRSRGEIPPVRSSRNRFQRAGKILSGGKAGLRRLMELSRDLENSPFGINNDAGSQPTMTLSSFIHVLRKEQAEPLSLSWVCNGNPSYTWFFPFYAGGVSSSAKHASCASNEWLFSKDLRVTDKHRDALAAADSSFIGEEEKFREEVSASGEDIRPEALDEKNVEWAERSPVNFKPA